MPRSGDVLTGGVEQGVVESGGEVVSLPTHTAPSPCKGKLFTAEMHHQRVDQACPDDTVALDIKGLDKNNMPQTDALAGRLEQGVVKPGDEVVSLPTHTASNPFSAKASTETHNAFEGLDKNNVPESDLVSDG